MGYRVSERYPFKPLFSASSLDAIIRCLGAATLPIVEVCSDESMAASAVLMGDGTAEHARVLSWENLPDNLRSWLTSGWTAEHSYRRDSAGIEFEKRFAAVFIFDGEAVPVDEASPSFLCGVTAPYLSAGTPDAFAFWYDSQGLHVRVGDLKTGAGQSAGRLPHPSQSWQLRYYALAVLLWRGWHPSTSDPTPDSDSAVGHVRLASCKISFWTRDYLTEREAEPHLDPADRKHVWRIIEAELSEELLISSVRQLQELTRQLTSAPSNVWRVGHWCGGCRSLMACPVHKNAIDRLGTATEGQLDDAKVSEAHDAIQVVEAQLEAARRSVEAYVAQRGEVQLRGNRTLVQVSKKLPRRVTALALPVLKDKFPVEYPAMVRESVSVSSIAAAVGEAMPGPRTAMVMAELETVRGAVVSGESFELRVRKNGSD